MWREEVTFIEGISSRATTKSGHYGPNSNCALRRDLGQDECMLDICAVHNK